MVDQNKVILMSKLAVEDKRFTKKDREITEYYPEDYVYVNNFKTRIIVLIMVGGVIAAQLLYKIDKGLNIPITIYEWVSEYIVPYGFVVLGALMLYSTISTLVYSKKYKAADKKRKKYIQRLKELEEYESSSK